ncbi:MAG: DUF3365 domain-containing protein [Bacteriovoracaceae bacterium]|nr:DUF3365 domain-containing protein [Bacteriovoracaceae bacterium]
MFTLFFFIFSLNAQTLKLEAMPLVEELKVSLMGNLKKELAHGSVHAIEFCQLNAQTLTQAKAKKYHIQRTSHRLRNPKNSAPELKSYLDKFAGTQKGALPMDVPVMFKDKEGKENWIAPIYTDVMCLQCHGEHIAKETQAALKVKYPQDQAIGFKKGEFRGFFWIKEK